MKTPFLLSVLWLLLAAMIPSSLSAATIAERRGQADKAMKNGNWNDALKVWREILVLPEHAGQPLAEDIGKAVQCVQQLNKNELWDAVVEDTVKAHPQDWKLLREAAVLYQQTQPWGTIISGEFQRAQHAGGKRVSSEDRDRVRSLQLFEMAMKSVATLQTAEGVRPVTSKVAGLRLKQDDTFVWSTGGGGGYGNPLEREPERVSTDVALGYVTAEGARRDYGVAVKLDNTVDEAETARLRGS